jgi:hypothetical protein
MPYAHVMINCTRAQSSTGKCPPEKQELYGARAVDTVFDSSSGMGGGSFDINEFFGLKKQVCVILSVCMCMCVCVSSSGTRNKCVCDTLCVYVYVYVCVCEFFGLKGSRNRCVRVCVCV